MELLSDAPVSVPETRGRYARLFALALALTLGLGQRADAQMAADEYEVKAAFVQNFARFVEWPSYSLFGTNGPFVVTVVGDDPIRAALADTVHGRLAHGHVIEIRHLSWDADLRGSHIVFVSASEERHLPFILASCDKAGVLTVSDIDRFALSGGMIELRMVGNRLRFDINRTVTQIAHLNVSAKLLSVARTVHGGPAGVAR